MKTLWILFLWILPVNGLRVSLPSIHSPPPSQTRLFKTNQEDCPHDVKPRMTGGHEKKLKANKHDYEVNTLTHFNTSNTTTIPEKIHELFRLTRIQDHFLPTSLLAFMGAYVTHPYQWREWILQPAFWTSYTITMCITMASMVINDIYDMEVDIVNSPHRPLVKGTVTVNEAKILTRTLYHLAIFLGVFHLPYHVLPFWVTSVVCTYLYTPVFKKITFIKNVTCALVVALTIPFMGLSVSNTPVYNVMVEAPWMFLTSHTTFMSSLYVEILLDILDKHGDQEANIRTLPVIFGINITLVLLTIILGMENYSAILFGAMNCDPWMIVATSLIYLPFYKNLSLIGASSNAKIHRDKSALVTTIRKSIKYTTIQMILYFLLVVLRTASTANNFTLL